MKCFYFCAFVSLWLIFVCACGPDLPSLDSLITHQPRVIAVDPADGVTVSKNTSVVVTFSIAVDPTSINPASFAVVRVDAAAPQIDGLAEDVSEGEVPVISGTYEISDDWRNAAFTPHEPFEAGATYGIIITTGVHTIAAIPLNQKPGEDPAPFWSTFKIKNEDSDQNYNDGESDGGDDTDEDVADGADEDGSDGQGPSGPQRPARLIINEVLYDALGDETDGNLFVELAGDAGSDIGGYKIVFINGAGGAETETVNIPDNSIIADDGIFLIADSRTSAPAETNIPGADFLDNFDPQNGPDCVQLLDDHGALLDAVGYGTPLPQTAQNGQACLEGTAAPDAPAGKSISRTAAADTADNAADFKILEQPTPGVL